jgi:hypothetical protein
MWKYRTCVMDLRKEFDGTESLTAVRVQSYVLVQTGPTKSNGRSSSLKSSYCTSRMGGISLVRSIAWLDITVGHAKLHSSLPCALLLCVMRRGDIEKLVGYSNHSSLFAKIENNLVHEAEERKSNPICLDTFVVSS